MTETRVIIDNDREATPDQMVTLQDGIEASIDHIVGDTLVPDRGYAGLAVSFAGTVVTIGAGRLYNGGKVYAFDTAATINMVSKLPVATKRQVIIYAFGTEGDTDVEQVNYLVEAQSTPAAPVYKPQEAATTRRRLALVQPAYGDEAANPPAPDVGLALPVATILLTPAGIASCANLVDGKVPVLADLATRTAALEAWEAEAAPQITSIASDVASLANAVKNGAGQALIGRILVSVADLSARVGIPSNAADSDTDYLLTAANSDIANPLSNCKVMEGIRFADDGAADAVLNLFNPFEANGIVKGGVLFPAYERFLRSTTADPGNASVLANSFTYNPVSYTQKTIARSRVRYGSTFTVCSNSAFWESGRYDPISGVFTLPNGETFKAGIDYAQAGNVIGRVGDDGDVLLHTIFRLQQFWTDSYTDTYWDAVVQAPVVVAGYHVAEVLLIGQDHWADAIGFFLPTLDNQGDVTVLVCECGANATPNPDAVLAKSTIPFAALQRGRNIASFATPVLFSAGKRVAIIIATVGGHTISTSGGANFDRGTFFVLSPSGFAQGDLTKHLCLEIYGCRFKNAVVSIPLQNLQLAGGMTAIDILAGTVVPASNKLVYEIQLAGLWIPLSALTVDQLNAGGSLPPNVPLRVTMAGTPDMMPALDLAHSNVHVSRPKTSFTHIWPKQPRTPPVATSQIRVIERFESWQAAFHTAGCQLLTGAGYVTATNPSSFTDVLTDDGALERTSVFNLGAAVTSYKVKTVGSTTTALKTFHGAYIKDYCL